MYNKCAVADFDDKPFKLEGMMMTEVGRMVAKHGTSVIESGDATNQE